MKKPFKSKYEKFITALLTNYPATRCDNDIALYEYFIVHYFKLDTTSITVNELFTRIKNKKIPSWKTIGRLRQDIQKFHPELRPAGSRVKGYKSKPIAQTIAKPVQKVEKPQLQPQPAQPVKKKIKITTPLPPYKSKWLI